MQKKNNYVNYIFIGVFIYVIYFFYNKFNSLLDIQNQQNLNSQIDIDISNYTAKYFKDSEYFKGKPIPDNYYKNWKYLSFYLDKIRTSYGAPIYILFGYELPKNNLLESGYNICTAVSISVDSFEKMSKLKDTISFLQSTSAVNFKNIVYATEYIHLEI